MARVQATLQRERMEIDFVPVKNLFLDEQNPRLIKGALLADTDKGREHELIGFLWRELAVDEVALSIAANGYFKEEPLLVIPRNPKESDIAKRHYIVVEGNRRLAAVKLLLDSSLRQEVGASDLPTISPQRRQDLLSLPVSIFDNRRELWAYVGFRHINGPKPWDAYSKAKYVANVHEQYKIPLTDIAEKIGDRHATVRRLYRGYKILEQAEDKVGFDRADIARNRFYFSHLYTAVDQPEFQKLLGITDGGSLRKNPVPSGRLDNLRDIMMWLYGSRSKGIDPIIRSQNPDLNILREVIGKPKAVSALRAGLPLKRAQEIGIGDKRLFRDALTRTKEDLQQAKATLTTGDTGEQDLLELMKEIVSIAESVMDEMLRKRK